MWLPPNATSEYQPLDQGIIANWKTHVRKQFVIFMATTFDKGKNLLEEMHVLRAIRWGIQAWENGVQPSTIQSCWRRSQAVDYGAFPAPNPDLWSESADELESIRLALVQMRSRGVIQSVPNIRTYISPYSGAWNERVDDAGDIDDIIDDVVGQNTQQEVDLEEEEGQPIREPPPKVTHSEALFALHTLRRYEEEYKGSSGDFLWALRQFERELGTRHTDSLAQSTIDRFFVRGGQLGPVE